jgi:hypothetical protein
MDVQVYDCKKYNLKPEIRIGNYYFRWDTNGLGIDVHEINHLKNFIRKTIPVLEQYMILLQHEKQNNHDKRDPYRDKKQICIKEKCNKRTSFLLFIDSQGATVFYREESCDIVDFELESGDQVYSENSSNSSSSNTSDRNNHDHDHGCGRRHIRVELKWLLGELLFDRKLQKQKKIKFRL